VIEQRVQQVLEIETQATDVYEQAVRDANRVVEQATQEAEAIVERSRTQARADAEEMLKSACARAQEERGRILNQADADAQRFEAVAMSRFDRAVTFVLNRVAGTE
jgi:vacuolar-type H+-ATPase subunit H